METQKDLMKIGIGTKETTSALSPAKVKIVSVTIQTEKKDGTKMDTPLVHFNCKHPDKEELISLSKVKYEIQGKLSVVGLWAQLDADGLYKKSSGVSAVLNFLNVKSLEESYGKEINTSEQAADNKYLCLKAY